MSAGGLPALSDGGGPSSSSGGAEPVPAWEQWRVTGLPPLRRPRRLPEAWAAAATLPRRPPGAQGECRRRGVPPSPRYPAAPSPGRPPAPR